MPLAVGSQLGPYEVVAALGAGGMGEVYRARDGRLGRDVAVKVLPEAFAARADRLARFEREARAAGALAHGGPRRGRCSAPRATCRRSRCGVTRSITAPTSSRWARCSTEILAGEPAFLRAARPETLLAILGEDPPDLARVRPPVPPAVRALVRRCLEKDPGERFQSARDLAFATEGLLSGSESLDTPPAGGASAIARGWLDPRGWAVAALAVLVPLAVASGWLLRGPGAAPALGTPRQITSDPGWEAEPALSPDGSFVAYVSDRSGNPDVWVSDVRGGDPLRLTDDPASDTSPAWLPDGSAIVFVSDRGGAPAVWKAPRLGGSATHLLANAWDPAVSPDASRIAFTRPGSSGYTRVAVVSVGEPTLARWLTDDQDGLWDHRQPSWSPDGRQIAYADARNLWVVPAAGGGRARRVTATPGPDGEPAWSPTGDVLYYSSYRDDTMALWRLPLRGGEAARVTLGTGPEVEPSLAGPRLAFSTYLSNMDVVLVDLRSGERRRLPGLRTETTPALAPDGSQVVFDSDRGGTVDLWSQRLDDGRPVGPARRLTDDVATENLPTVSPDGRWLAFGRVLSGQRDIWTMPLAGGPARRVTEDPGVDKQPAWSPDGTHLAFVSERGGTGQVWVVRVAEGVAVGDPARVTSGTDEAFFPSWSPDGARLSFLRRRGDGFAAWVAAVDGSAPARQVVSPVAFARWDRTIDRLLVAQAEGAGTVGVLAVDPRSGAIRPLARPVTLRAVGSVLPFDVSADDALLATHEIETRGDIWVVELKNPRHSWR